MPKYRTTEPVSFVKDGRAVSVKVDRVIELEDAEAKKLAGKILMVENRVKSMFPEGAPHIPLHVERPHWAKPVAGEAVEPEEKTVKPVRVLPRPEVKAEVKADAK